MRFRVRIANLQISAAKLALPRMHYNNYIVANPFEPRTNVFDVLNTHNVVGEFSKAKFSYPFSVREKVQTWMTGLVTEVKRKSPSMVHRWIRGERDEAADGEEVPGEPPSTADRSENAFDGRAAEDQSEYSAAGLRSKIKSKLHFNELYDKISRTRDITGLFQRTKTMEDKKPNDSFEELEENGEGSPKDKETEDEIEIDEKNVEVDPESPGRGIEAVDHGPLGNASSPKNSCYGEVAFSFEDFSFIEKSRVPLSSMHQNAIEEDSGCVDKSKEDESKTEKPLLKPRRLNMGEIGRSASASHHHLDSSFGDLSSGEVHTRRHLLCDIGRRFSEMNDSSDCEFRGGDHNRSSFRPNSMPVSPKPRMLLPAQQHRGSTDYSGGKQRGSMLLREHSTQVIRGQLMLKYSMMNHENNDRLSLV